MSPLFSLGLLVWSCRVAFRSANRAQRLVGAVSGLVALAVLGLFIAACLIER
jgi:small neutral amino acid transporter SnatA (MarC family)